MELTTQQKVNNRILQDKFRDEMMETHIEQCKVIIDALGYTNIRCGTLNQDRKQCTDIVAQDKYGIKKTFGLRIRTAKYRNFSDFTVRCKDERRSQIQKIWTSPITHYIYAWQNQEGILDRIYVLDMLKFKVSKTAKEQMLRNYKSNQDGTGFFYISLQRLDQLGMIIAK